MIKNRVVYSILAMLVIVFICAIGILPNLSIKEKNIETSYVSQVFNHNKVTTVDIELSDDDWKDMLNNPLKEEVKEATVTVNGKKLEHVGVRTKGNLSLREVANDDDSDRYSLKLDFDYYNDEQSLYGLKKLNLNNNYSDATQMREYLSYQLMEKMGLPTPSYAYMYVTVNGKDRGLFLGVEQVDETFLAKNFETNTGALYKPDGTGSDLKWISDDLDDYTGLNVKTKIDEDSENATVDFLKAINNKGKSLEDTANVDNLLRYFAVNTALVNLDSYQGNLKHNYYLYEENGKFNIIPWDYNMSFGGFGVGGGFRDPQPQTNTTSKQTDSRKNTNSTNSTTRENNSTEQNSNTTENGMPTPPDGNGQPPQGRSGQMPPGENDDQGGMQPPQGQNGEAPAAPQDSSNAQSGEQSKTNTKNDTSNANKKGNVGQKAAGASNSDLLAESSINFSITTPISGTTLEERPLLNVLLSNDQYKEKYEGYLKKVATSYLTENQIAVETAKIAKLIKPYVEKDPTKFFTKEDFEKAVLGDNSLPEFAKQRSKSILKQLSGELNVDNTPSNEDDKASTNDLTKSKDNERKQKQKDRDTSTNKNAAKGNGMGQEPNVAMAFGGNGQGQPGGNMGQGGPQNVGQNQVETGTSKETLIMDGIATSVLLLAIIAVFIFKRRGRKLNKR
ncbi:CotH kinase family protein [Rummeliibacillus sp. POC4]|uniref:CotH kinase family protein n=1 Tax=Rummeliibacillus sp. POC4 TaxID=2305899 RepID=UPI001314A6C5|nr:CotH kinase family protein [Rummeliibacillus sp. POC4]